MKQQKSTETEKIDSKAEHNSNNSESSFKEEEKFDMDVDFGEEPVIIVEESKSSKEEVASGNSQGKKGIREKQKASKRRRDKSKELPSKKRKRIIERNSSDSDGENFLFFLLVNFLASRIVCIFLK